MSSSGRGAPLVTPPDPISISATTGVATESKAERRWFLCVACLALILSLVPYLVGYARADGRAFLWLGYNLDDSCVYLSWMRQAADRSLRAYNLFTTDAQHGMALNPLFLVLGRLAGWTHLPLIAVYQGSRLALGGVMLWTVWAFLARNLVDSRARKLAFLCVCFSSGLGWLPLFWPPPLPAPVDTWQPEAITFLSLYLSPLFCASMALQVAILTLLLDAYRTGSIRRAAAAGLCGLVLGLVHSYDIISLAAVWLLFLVIAAIRHRSPGALRAWLQALLAGAITAPAVAYIYQQFRSEAVFRARANVATLSPPPVWVLRGYGLTLLLAVFGAWLLTYRAQGDRAPNDVPTDPVSPDEGSAPPVNEAGAAASRVAATRWTTDALVPTFLIAWAVANVAISYLPHAAFQRKLLQGAHFPIAILAGVGLSCLLSRPAIARDRVRFSVYATMILFLLSLTNQRFVLRDIANYAHNLSQTRQQRPYVQPGELEALDWIESHAPKSAAIQPLPWLTLFRTPDGRAHVAPIDSTLACLTPGRIHRKVYCGHWGETPDYRSKLNEVGKLCRPDLEDGARALLLQRMRVDYLVFSQKDPDDASADVLFPMLRGRAALPPYLQLVHSNSDADVYHVDPILLHAAESPPVVAPKPSATRVQSLRP